MKNGAVTEANTTIIDLADFNVRLSSCWPCSRSRMLSQNGACRPSHPQSACPEGQDWRSWPQPGCPSTSLSPDPASSGSTWASQWQKPPLLPGPIRLWEIVSSCQAWADPDEAVSLSHTRSKGPSLPSEEGGSGKGLHRHCCHFAMG